MLNNIDITLTARPLCISGGIQKRLTLEVEKTQHNDEANYHNAH